MFANTVPTSLSPSHSLHSQICADAPKEEFHPGLIAMKSYLDGLKGPEENFDGAKLYELINAFRKSLSHHLASEIPSLIGLKESGDRIPLRELFEKEGEKNMRNWGRRLRYRLCF